MEGPCSVCQKREAEFFVMLIKDPLKCLRICTDCLRLTMLGIDPVKVPAEQVSTRSVRVIPVSDDAADGYEVETL